MPAPRIQIKQDADAIFVNRDKPLQRFDQAVAAIPSEGVRFLVFYGLGGQGKTALCREIRRRVSSDHNPQYSHLCTAELDLHGRDNSDPVFLLVWIRNGFADAGVPCPAFDLALAITWEATRPEQPFPKLTKAWLAKSSELITEATPDAIALLREVLEQTVETIPLLGSLATRASKWMIDRSKRAWLHHTRAHLEHLYRAPGELKKPYELTDLLPWMLAQDLNHHKGQNPEQRFLLLVDEYERVFDQGGAGRRWEENSFDANVRRFVAETNGLLSVFFSRERLPWENETHWHEDLEDTQHLLGGLTDADAMKWLQVAGVERADLREAMIDGAREEPRPDAPVYPLLLELQLEHWRQLTTQKLVLSTNQFHLDDASFSDRYRALVRRVLRDYGPELQFTIERLSVALRFDRAAFAYVVDTFGTGLPQDAFSQIMQLSFVTPGDDGYWTMHRAFAEAVKAMLEPDRRQSSIEMLLKHYENRTIAPSLKELAQENVTAAFDAAYLRQQLGASGYADWLSECTAPMQQAAWYPSCEQLWRTALAFSEEKLGEEHPSTAESYNNVAANLDAQGRYEEAEPLVRKGLEINARVLGEEHPDTATSYNNVAANLGAQGRYEEAEPLYRKGLEIRARVLGEEHRNTAASYNNVAANLNAQGRYEEAEPLVRKGLEINARVLGEEHPDTATSYNNVAANLDDQGRYEEAEPLYRKGLEIRARVLGEEHPSTATSYNNVAYSLDAQGRYEEAEPLVRKGLEINARVLGEEHPDTATSYNNVAANLDAQGRYEEAEPLYHKGLEINARVLGEEHPSTTTSYNNVAANLDAQDRYEEAEPLFRKGLEINARVLGEEHPDTATSYNNVAANLNAQGRYEEAEPLYRKGLKINARVLGEEHPSTATSYNNVAANLDAQDRYEEAEPLFRKGLEINARVLGEEHPLTATSYNNVAANLGAQGRYEEAEPLFRKAVILIERVLGPDHPNSKIMRGNLKGFLAQKRS